MDYSLTLPSAAPCCSHHAHHCACGGCGGYGGSAHPCCGPAVTYVPVPWPAAGHAMIVPHELDVDVTSPAQEALVGGRCDAHLTLEYLVEAGAAATAQVTVTVTSDGTTSTWTDTGISEGYHVKDGFLTVKPGSKVKVEVTDAIARLRWCETICC